MNGFVEQDVAQAAKAMLLNILAKEVHTAMPAAVTEVSATLPLMVTAKPLLRSVSIAGKQRAFPEIQGVLLLTFGTQSTSVQMPVAKGDLVLLVFCERSLEKWTGKTDPADTIQGRHFEIADAFAIPFNFSAINAADPMSDALYDNKSLVIKQKHTTGNTMVELLQSGNVAITTTPTGLVTLNGKAVADGGTLLPTDGVVTGMCSCSITGAPHPVVSLTVLAKGLVP
ncbi:MAG TPA: Gp138 family membrane-puncturing spike protein [Chitinivibrionales bacterium]|nr:Gp138 family membrane-puncturing spike protein [Chitinivibrionales bacterium]